MTEECTKLANIIKGFREGELNRELNGEHVHKWICQFDKEHQQIVLSETIFVFSKWYFNLKYIQEKFIKGVLAHLEKKYSSLEGNNFFMKVVFVDMQAAGRSQKILLSMIDNLILEQYGIHIKTEADSQIYHYIYVDDGLFTGSRCRKDVKNLLELIPAGSKIDIFFLVACTSGLQYADKDLRVVAEDKEIKLELFRYHYLNNVSKIITVDNTQEYSTSYDCLWPSKKLKDNPFINDYYLKLLNRFNKVEYKPYRDSPWINDKGIFSSEENRDIVEYEFLKYGILLAKASIDNKGLFPLGYNLWPSFGLGSFCASDINVPNTAPLVIWSNIGGWYPLLPRRTNYSDMDNEEDYDFDIWDGADYCDTDAYNVCPDCGMAFGILNDGGNGFCKNCAPNH